MSLSKLTILVTGATGVQGGALAHQLLQGGHKVRALVRNPEKQQAKDLVSHGAEIIKGDFDDTKAIEEAVKGCDGIFINTFPTPQAETEIQQVENFIQAAKRAGVKHAIYSSVSRGGEHEDFKTWDPNGIMSGYWIAKGKNQEQLMEAGFETWTVLQPAWLMTNWFPPLGNWYFPTLAKDHTLTTAYGVDTKISLTAPWDIGSFALKAFTEGRNGVLANRIVPVGGDILTMAEMVEEVSKATGVEIQVKYRSDEEVEALKGKDRIVASQHWARNDGTEIDLENVRSYGLKLTTFRDFVENRKDDFMTVVGAN